MTHDDIAKLWNKAHGWTGMDARLIPEVDYNFARLVAAAEREACATIVCEHQTSIPTGGLRKEFYEAIMARRE